MAAIGYYVFALPFSYLPLPVMYLFTDLFYLLFITVVPYRKAVIEKNLRNSFPEMSDKEIKRLRNKFYRHLTDLLAEGIKNLTISERSIKKRFKVTNPEIMERFFDKKRDVIVVSGHYNNWEWMVSSMPLQFPHEAVGIGMPLSSGFWDKKLNARRSRFGMHVVHAKNYKQELEHLKDKTKAVLVLTDQSPGDSLKSYWTRFLNQETAVLFGAEMIANELDYAVVYYTNCKVKRGYYELTLQVITEEPRSLAWGELTEKHTQLLEKDILNQPENWLWSHKRWKRDVPENLDQLKEQQRAKFEERFRN